MSYGTSAADTARRPIHHLPDAIHFLHPKLNHLFFKGKGNRLPLSTVSPAIFPITCLRILRLMKMNPDGAAVVWLRIGNCSNRALLQWLAPMFPHILDCLRQGQKLIEII
jgi:hypothetical protein